MLDALDRFAEHPVAAMLFLAAGIALLLAGGHGLVNGSVAIARRLGVSTLWIGLTLVAFGTSSPELAFNIIAAVNDHPELSFGNVVGSNIANFGLVLGIAALLKPLAVHGRVVRRELPWLIVVSFAVMTLALAPPGPGGKGFGRLDGALLLAGFAWFMLGWSRLGRREAADPLIRELGEEAATEKGPSTRLAWLFVVGGLVGLVLGGKLSETGAVGIARWAGLSEALIGLTIVAVATSLPELTASVIACRKGHDDLAIGNLVGSNFFNLLLVLGATALVAPVSLPAGTGLADLIAMNVITLLLLPVAMSNRFTVTRPEGGLLLGLYLVYMAWRVVREVA